MQLTNNPFTVLLIASVFFWPGTGETKTKNAFSEASTTRAASNLRISPDSERHSGCDLALFEEESPKPFLNYFRKLKAVAKQRNFSALGKMYSPAEPLSAREAKRIFSPKVLKIIDSQKVEDIFCKWSGVMLGNGEVWLNAESKGHWGIRDVYTPEIQELEIRARNLALKKGPLEVFRCRTKVGTLVVYEVLGGTMKVRMWESGIPNSQPPSHETNHVTVNIEGTGYCSYNTWSFEKNGAKHEVSAEPGCTDGTPEMDTGSYRVEYSSGKSESYLCLK